jgi:hypothetical protein
MNHVGYVLGHLPFACFTSKGARVLVSEQVNFTRSKCANKVHFSYSVASLSTDSSPCSNVPLHCPICPASEPCVWRYNFQHHLQAKHPAISLPCYELLWQILSAETYLVKETWVNCHKQKKMCMSKKNKLMASLVVSEAPSSQLALQQ